MNLLIRISLFFGFLSVISCTHILPTQSKKIIKILYDGEVHKRYAEHGYDQISQKYNKELGYDQISQKYNKDLASQYKKFDDVFEIQILSYSEFRNSSDDITNNIVCYFSDVPGRFDDFDRTKSILKEKFPQKKVKVNLKNEVVILTYFDFVEAGHTDIPHVSNSKIINEKRGEFEIHHLAANITDIKIKKTKEEIKKELELETLAQKKEEARKKWEETKPLLLKSSLIGGGFVAIGLVSAYILTRKKQTKPVLNSLNVKNKSNRHTTTTHLFPAEQPK